MSNIITEKGHQLSGVDIGKYIMALGVVALHVAAGGCTGIEFPPLFTWFIRLGVPFYFVTSGFLLKRELINISSKDQKLYLRNRCKKILRLYVSWIAIYLPISIAYSYIEHITFQDFLKNTILTILKEGEILYAWPLWFLYSLLIITFGLFLTIRYRPLQILFLAFVITIYFKKGICDYLEIYGHFTLLPQILYAIPTRPFLGGVYIFCGMVIYTYYQKISNLIISLLLISGSLLLFLNKLACFELLGGIALFILYSLADIKNKKIGTSLRIQSMWIYYLHMYVIFTLVVYARINSITLQLWPTYLSVVTVIMIIAFLLSRLQLKHHFRYLNFLTK